jgi:hypothetical protein
MDSRPTTANGDSFALANINLLPSNEASETALNGPSEEDIRRALWRELESGDDNIDFSEEQLSDLSHTLLRVSQLYRMFHSANPERRQAIKAIFRERMNNERLSRILQVPVSDDGALDLFRTVRTEILWEVVVTTDLGVQRPISASNYGATQSSVTLSLIGGSPSTFISDDWSTQSTLTILDDEAQQHSAENTITVSDIPRRETIRATRSALRMLNRIPDTAANRGTQPGANAVNQGRQPQAIALYNSPLLMIRPSRLTSMWTNIFQKQQEKKHIRQEIEATSTAKLAPPLNETELIQSLVCPLSGLSRNLSNVSRSFNF